MACRGGAHGARRDLPDPPRHRVRRGAGWRQGLSTARSDRCRERHARAGGRNGHEAAVAAARRHHQRCQLPQSHTRARHRRGAKCRGRAGRACLRAVAEAARLDCRRQAQHGWARVRQERGRPGHAALQPDLARRAGEHDPRRERRVVARHPERDPSAICGQGDAVDRHLHGWRIDLGQCARHGSSRGVGRADDSVDARDARRRHDPHRQPVRRHASVQSRGRRIRVVRRNSRRRSGSHPECRLPLVTRNAAVPRVRAGADEPIAARSELCADLRALVDGTAIAARRDAAVRLPASRCARRRHSTAR